MYGKPIRTFNNTKMILLLVAMFAAFAVNSTDARAEARLLVAEALVLN